MLFAKAISLALPCWIPDGSNRGTVIFIQNALTRPITHIIPLFDTNAVLAKMWPKDDTVKHFTVNYSYCITTEEMTKIMHPL